MLLGLLLIAIGFASYIVWRGANDATDRADPEVRRAAREARRAKRERQRVQDRPPPVDEDPCELALNDPVEALLRYGINDDATRLIAEGRGDDLSGLGWRDPGAS